MTISNTINSRDIIARIEELENERDDCESPERWVEAFPEEAEELATLQALAEEAENSPYWSYGETLIHEDYFETYMDEMIADCYTLPKDLPFWMTISYDYDALKQDYFEVDFDGQTYLIRA